MASFDRLGAWYGRLERWFSGGVMQRARLALVNELAAPRKVLLIGEGPGALVGELAERFPRAQLTCLDISEKLVQQGRAHLDRKGGSVAQCDWIVGDVRTAALSGGPWDLMVTSFVLDCFAEEELAVVVPKLAENLQPGGEWLFVDFQIPQKGGPCRWRAAAVVWLLYRFFRVTTGISATALVPPQPFFARAGLRLVVRRELGWGLVQAEVWRQGRGSV